VAAHGATLVHLPERASGVILIQRTLILTLGFAAPKIEELEAEMVGHNRLHPRTQVTGLLAVGVVIAALIIYIPTVAPTISWRNGGADSGDFAAAVATLGIPHPPGYPTYVLLGRAWTALPLGGDLAYQLNLLSATSAALAAGLSVLAIGLLNRNLGFTGLPLTVGALFGGITLALAPLIWSQATIAETYAPGLAVLSLLSLCLFWWWYQDKQWALIVAGFVGGLGVGVLPQIVLVVPGAVILLYAKTKRNRRQGWPNLWRHWLGPLLIATAIGLSIFIYLPLRATVQPMVNWGDPRTLDRFWAVVAATQYHQYLALIGPGEWFNRFFDGIMQIGQQLSWAGLGLALLGGYTLWHHDRAIVGYLASLIGLTILFRTSYPVMGNIVYLIPALYGTALLAGIGTAWLLSLAQKQIGVKAATVLGLGFLVVFSLRAVAIAPTLDISTDNSAALFGKRILTGLPSNALVVSERDETTFSLWYLQALGVRPDVAVVDRRLLVYDWYQHQLIRRYPDLDPQAMSLGRFTALARPVYVLEGLPGKEMIRSVAVTHETN